MAICSDFSFHRENLRMLSSLRHFLGTQFCLPHSFQKASGSDPAHLLPRLLLAQLDPALPQAGDRKARPCDQDAGLSHTTAFKETFT